MTRRNAWTGLVAAVALSLCLTACKDTKTLQENEQLKTQIADLQKQNTQMSSDLQAAIAARDALQKENDSLKARQKPKKSKRSAKKSSRKRRTTN
jgi:FtsZ-binding cell division protein ZapB